MSQIEAKDARTVEKMTKAQIAAQQAAAEQSDRELKAKKKALDLTLQQVPAHRTEVGLASPGAALGVKPRERGPHACGVTGERRGLGLVLRALAPQSVEQAQGRD